MIDLDSRIDEAIVTAFPIFKLSPSAARSILSSIVGAMISATGVVFSMTIVALSLASSQFGSRLIRTYRSRRSTHFTLGIFVSTSLYCILVLTSIRDTGYVFVPTVAVGVGILLTVICLSTLIYYIHDMSYAIQASSVIDKSASDLHAATQRLFPEKIGEKKDQRDREKEANEEAANKQIEDSFSDPLWTIKCDCVGYVQAIENESVMAFAREQNLVVHLLLRPGDFIYEGSALAKVYAASDAGDLDIEQESVNKELRNSLIVDNNRTPTEDIRYAFDELTEVAVRALSPGINDPFTAVNCVDRILAALRELKDCETPSRYRADEDGILRVIADPVPFETCLENSLGVVEHYARDSPMVLQRIKEASRRLSSES